MCAPVEVWIWILLVMNPFNAKTLQLIKRFNNDVTETARAIRDGKCNDLLSDSEKKRAKEVHNREVRAVIEKCSRNGIGIVTIDNEDYPELLKHIYNPPIVLFVRGSLKGIFDKELPITVIGTRNPSEYSIAIAKNFCEELAKVGTLLISGLALGTDTIVHKSAVKCGTPTIGVLACGSLVQYPYENEQLKRDIIERGGAVISELLPETGVDPTYFRYRNRIMSGLSFGTLIIEASLRSGCLLTAGHAIEQGRDIFCVPPHDINNNRYMGVAGLLRDGAIPAFSYLDIINEYLYNYCHMLEMDNLSFKKIFLSDQKNENKSSQKETIKTRKEKTYQKAADDEKNDNKAKYDEKFLETLDKDSADIMRIILKNPVTMSDILDLVKIEHIRAAEIITYLEINGYIIRKPDGKYMVC